MSPMVVMLIGIGLFFGLHTYSALRSRDPVKDIRIGRETLYMAVYSVVSIVGLALIIIGYRQWGPSEALYQGATWTYWLAAILMAPALVLFTAGNLPPGRIRYWVGHPMVMGTLLWASAHLLTGFSLRSALLFAPFALWAALDFLMATRREPKPVIPAAKWDIFALIVGIGAYLLLLMWGHAALGADPLPV